MTGDLRPLQVAAAVTVGLLGLTEQHALLPGALAAFAAAWWLLRALPRESPDTDVG